MSMSNMLGKLIMAGLVAKGVSMAGSKSGGAGGGGLPAHWADCWAAIKAGVLTVVALPVHWADCWVVIKAELADWAVCSAAWLVVVLLQNRVVALAIFWVLLWVALSRQRRYSPRLTRNSKQRFCCGQCSMQQNPMVKLTRPSNSGSWNTWVMFPNRKSNSSVMKCQRRWTRLPLFAVFQKGWNNRSILCR